MSTSRRLVIFISSLLLSASAVAQQVGKQMIFVGCPILRTTSLPCWLGESGGELYYLGPQGDLTADFYPPEFRHKMLVEGVITSGPRICGGVVLKPVKVSVLPEMDVTCNIMLPAMAYDDPPHVRGTGPSGVRGGEAPSPPPRPRPVEYTPPFKAQVFTANFNADSERLWNQAQAAVTAAARYASVVKASNIQITGYRAAMRLSNGQQYIENPSLAELRAKAISQALQTAGVPSSAKIIVAWQRAAVASKDMAANQDARRVSIVVVP
jgi:outer membrane protein OmpA-like peptidoglycan-associated protein